MKSTFLFLLSVPFILGSCAQPSLTGDTYSRGEAGRVQSVERGTIIAIRNVKLEGESGTGTLLGAVAGGLLANQIGGGSGRRAATVAGTAVGGIAGSHIGQNVTSRPGMEIEVKLDSGGTLAIVQERSARDTFKVGDRVRVVGTGSRARVSY
ncbi:MAG: glycine zipper 2TM domain-containing protein [Luteolibacter sp.]